MILTIRTLWCVTIVCLMATWAQADSFTFAIVPQQSAQKLAENWQPLFDEIEKKTGMKLVFRTAPTIPEFEKRLSEGKYDFAYMNPYHYTEFSKDPGYVALAKEESKQLKGIIVVAKDDPAKTLADLSDSSLAFPAPLAFAATLLTQAHLKEFRVGFSPVYVRTHDSVYLNVAQGAFRGGGGVYRTFNNMDDNVKSQLRVLWASPGFTPHAIAAHPRVSPSDVVILQSALADIAFSTSGKSVLNSLGMKGFVTAKDADWNDVRSLGLGLD